MIRLIYFFFSVLIFPAVSSIAQPLLPAFFDDIAGSWIGAPDDSSFISHLDYTNSKNGFLVIADNRITSKTGVEFAMYEGVYLFNPVEQTIFFTTITMNEVHNGIAEIKGDTLFHEAGINGNGNIKSYASAIVKIDDGTLHYYADYSTSDTVPELRFQNPLIYRKKYP